MHHSLVVFRIVFLVVLTFLLAGCNIEVQVSGQGLVVSDPGLIHCRETGGTCYIENYEDYDLEIEDLIVTFKAIADEGYVLSHWEGDCERTLANKCYVSLGEDVSVSANFVPIRYAPNNEETKNMSVSFIALGDAGKGNSTQYAVANGIRNLCSSTPCDFVLGLGDNFYNGTPNKIDSPLFEEKFERPYQQLSMPFFMILGNHDTGRFEDGDGGNQALGEVQVAYHYRNNRTSNKWKMPARYYSFDKPNHEKLARFFAIDTAPFVGLVDSNEKYEVQRYAEQQARWFEHAQSLNSADWNIAFGHHPYVSNGRHGNAGNYDKLLPGSALLDKVSGKLVKQFVENTLCNKVDLYISGHDHNLQALKPVAPCGLTTFVVSGAGASARSLEKPGDNAVYGQNGSKPGFFYLQIKGNTLHIRSYGVLPERGEPVLLFEKRLRKTQLN